MDIDTKAHGPASSQFIIISAEIYLLDTLNLSLRDQIQMF